MMTIINQSTANLIITFILISSCNAFQVTTERRRGFIKTSNEPITTSSVYHHLHESTTPTSTVQKVPSSSSSSSEMIGTNLPPVLQQIANERAEYQINLGRAMDTLRKDMPYILSQTPDFSIYHDDISVIDPSGVQLKGIDKYKSAFAFLQTFTKFWFHQNSNTIQYRMVYDFCRNSIRISWHIVLVSKFIPTSRPLHIDGISYYQMHVESGKIMEHKIETLIVNNTPIAPPYGILSILQQDVLLGNTGLRPSPQGLSGTYIVVKKYT